MICRNCGNNIGDRVVCPYCGMQNQQYQDTVTEKTKKSNNLGPIIIMILAVIMAIAVFVFVNMNKVKVEEEEASSSNTNTNTNLISNTNTNSIEDSSNSESNVSSNVESNTNVTSNTNSTTTPEHLTCTQNLSDAYGTYQSTHEYVFKNNQLYSYKMTTVATLKNDYYSYRDSLLSQYDEANSTYKNIRGIDVSYQKKANGFTYIVKIDDASKVDREKLRSMNLYLINYSGVKVTAYKNGLTCE